MAEIDFEIKGLTPLVTHNCELADRDGEFGSRLGEISSKQKKTAEDRAAMARIEFEGGLYWDDKLGPVLTDGNLLGMIVEGAKVNKLGKIMEAFVSISDPRTRIDYKGPRDIEGMWKAHMWDRRPVSVDRKKIMRTRPMFKEWSVKFTALVEDDEVDPKNVVEAVRVAGKRCGIGERTKFRWGRFEVAKAVIRK